MQMPEMTSMERVLTTLSHKEPDRVPLMLLFSMYGAKELQIPIKEYFESPERVVEAQLMMLKKYRNDCLNTFQYAPVEITAWGGEVIFVEDGPPNSGEPFLKNLDQFLARDIPRIEESKGLMNILEVTERLKKQVGDQTPIVGVVMSPYSLPVMQMGFEKYIELIYYQRDQFNLLMNKNIEFCVKWANAQFKAGATAICYFDPLASPTIIDQKTYTETGFDVAKRTLAQFNGPSATHLASGITVPVIDQIAATGSALIGFSEKDSLKAVKEASSGKITLLGNLNGVEMASWSVETAENRVKELIKVAAPKGGFILSDQHGEIPWQVPESVLLAISDAVTKWGTYPLKWVGDEK